MRVVVFFIYIYIHLFSRRRENRASASIDFSYVCSESVAKFLRVSYILAPSQNQPHRSVFRCLWVLLSVLLLRNHNMYFVFVFCTKPRYCRPFSRRTKKKKRQPFARSVSTASHQKTYSALTMQRVHLIDTAVISYLMTALSSPLFPSLHGR